MRAVRRRRAERGSALLGLAAVAALVLAACAGGNDSTAAVAATPVPSTGPILVTFLVGDDERYKVLLTHPDDIATARALLAGGDAPGIPDGKVVHTTGVNTGWSWSIDPDDIAFIDETDEACDGAPSDVETGSVASDRYCPSAAEVVSIDPPP